jgi:two-component sensor histidine kinase
MAQSRSSIFLEVIESLSKSSFISEGDINGLAKFILPKATELLKIERANIWLNNADDTGMDCLLAYKRRNNEFYTEPSLNKEELPLYFEHIRKNEIIISIDVQQESFNQELLQDYLIPLDIQSMMEVPIISGGKLKGIICFEHLHNKKDWSNDEQHFAVALTQLFIITMETREKNHYRSELEKLLKEKTLLISEINHRVKNNLAIINALIRGESNKVLDQYHKDLFDNVLSKTYSLSALQDSMYHSQNYKEVEFQSFLQELVGNFNKTFGYGMDVKVRFKSLDKIILNVNTVIPLSLIVNEILTNSYKYAFKDRSDCQLTISLVNINAHHKLTIIDNGPGLPLDHLHRGTGFGLISDLIEQIDGKLDIQSNSSGTSIEIVF